MIKRQFILTGIVLLILATIFVSYLILTAKPLVSVIMLTYNRADMVGKAIESILNQTYQNFELIIINDGSTDDTINILKQYASQDKRIKIFTNVKNKKIVYSRNLGLNVATGKYIAWMDDDDISEPTRLYEQVKFMEKHHDIIILGTDISLLNGRGRVYLWPVEYLPEQAEIAFLIGRLPVILPTTMWRKDFFDYYDIRFSPKFPVSEDFPIYDNVFKYHGKIMTLPRTLYRYRLHHSNGKNYYDKFKILQKTFYHDRWEKFYSGNTYPETQCARLNFIKNNNAYFNQNLLDNMYHKHCKTDIYLPTGYGWIIPFNDTEEAVVVSKNGHTFYSYKMQKFGTLIKGTDKYSKILWDGDTEIIEYKNKF